MWRDLLFGPWLLLLLRLQKQQKPDCSSQRHTARALVCA
jgi:hypothetical protein